MISSKYTVFVFALFAINAFAALPAKVGMDLLTDPFSLPLLRDHELSLQVSSHDKLGGNEDGGRLDSGIESFLYKDENNEFVLLDEIGSGYVGRIWFTKLTEGNIHIYIDGESEPSVDLSLFEFFTGNHPPFSSPLTGDENVCSGGYISYTPIFFTTSIRISVSSRPYYYNITYKKLSSYYDVESFDPTLNVDEAIEIVQNGPARVLQPYMQDSLSTIINLQPSQSDTIQLADTHTITHLQLTVTEQTGSFKNLADSLWLYAQWDDHTDFDIQAPIGLFFGGGIDDFACRAFFTGSDPAAKYCYSYFPMPFQNSAVFILKNTSSQTVKLNFTVTTTPELPGELLKDCGYFKTDYKKLAPVYGQDMLVFETHGRGHLVGTVMDMRGGLRPTHLEGDEMIYIDDSSTPQIYGTGTEDYFNGGWYFKNGLFSLPFNGFTYGAIYGDIRQNCYRHLIVDNINFNRHIEFYMEHGPDNTTDADYQALTMYYHADEPNLLLMDSLDIADPIDETNHVFECDNQAASVAMTAFYEGAFDIKRVTDAGRRMHSLHFNVELDPLNTGVRLVRRFNYADKNQQAGVYVDGVYVGEWYDPGGNTEIRWRDSSFELAQQLTAGKSQIEITIKASSGTTWNAFKFWVYCYQSMEQPNIHIQHPQLSAFLDSNQSTNFSIGVQNDGQAALFASCTEKVVTDKKNVLFTGWGNTDVLPFRDAFLQPWNDHDFEITSMPDIPASISGFAQIILFGTDKSTSTLDSDSLDQYIENGGVVFVFGGSFTNELLSADAHSSAVQQYNNRQYLIDVIPTTPHEITDNLPLQIAFRGWAENVQANADAQVLLQWQDGSPYLMMKKYGNGYMVYISHESAWNSATWYGDESTGLQLCSQILDWLENNAVVDWFSISPELLNVQPGNSGEFLIHINPNMQAIPAGRYYQELVIHHNDPFVNLEPLQLVVHFGRSHAVVLDAAEQGYCEFDQSAIAFHYSMPEEPGALTITDFPDVRQPYVEAEMAMRIWDVQTESGLRYKPEIRLSESDRIVYTGRFSKLCIAAFVDDEWLSVPTVVDSLTGMLTSQIDLSGDYRLGYGLMVNSTTLPVELSHFAAQIVDGDSVQIQWRTASESSNWGFELQRATDNSDFVNIAFISGHGTTQQTNHYRFMDYLPQCNELFYRLKQIDVDGSFKFSNNVCVSVQNFDLLQSYPNPFNSQTSLSYQIKHKTHVSIKIFDIRGRWVNTLVDEMHKTGNYTIRWDGRNNNGNDVANGLYFIELQHDQGKIIQKITCVK